MKLIRREFTVKLAHKAFPHHKFENLIEDVSIIKSDSLPSSTIIRRILDLCLNENTVNYSIESNQLKFLNPSEPLYSNPELDQDLRKYADRVKGAVKSFGAYTESSGAEYFREKIGEALMARDGVPANKNNIKLVQGLNVGVRYIFNAFINDVSCGVLSPRPNYPFYEKYIRHAQGTVVHFDFDWHNMYNTIENMQEAVDEARYSKVTPRILVISNPNNPTGKVFTPEEIQMVIEFAYKNSLMIVVDQSFQDVVLGDSEFTSFRKVLKTHSNTDIRDAVELVSMYSISRSVFQEPALRGGFMEFHNIDPDVFAMFDKFLTIMLCPNTVGQLAVALHFALHKLDTEISPQTKEVYMSEYTRNKNIMKEKRDNLLSKLRTVPDFEVYDSDGSYYTWCKLLFDEDFIFNHKISMRAFTDLYAGTISEKCGLNVFSGSSFLKPGYIRFSLMDKNEDQSFEKLLEINDKIRLKGFKV